MIPRDYTVVLRRPDYMGGACEVEMVTVMCDESVPEAVQALDETRAIEQAKMQRYIDDLQETLEPESPDDYALVVLFAGRQPPLQYGE